MAKPTASPRALIKRLLSMQVREVLSLFLAEKIAAPSSAPIVLCDTCGLHARDVRRLVAKLLPGYRPLADQGSRGQAA